jgi:serine/threonine protein kinase/Tol biopolymer transport system component
MMSLDAGTKLGRYEIRSKIGEGGMGEVYLAHDTELKRTVALKFLPAEVASDHKRLERFEREALAASALNHPNILTVYDIGKTGDGRRFFVTEFVEGATLREHVNARRPKLGEVLDMAAQIAGALVEAHAHGIVHRDIKPENVMVRRDGYLKVLDFGLAKLTGGPSSGVDPEAATRALVVTDAGTVMGTVSYMSPEQSQGVEVDARTDVWSLGVVLYEMLTGRVPFGGKSASHTIVAIHDDEPAPLAAYMAEAPELLQEVVSDALAKDRDARLTAKQMLAKLQRLKRRLDLGTLDSSFVPNVSTASGDVSRGATASHPGVTTGGAQATTLAAANTAGVGLPETVSSVEFVATKIGAHKKGFIIALVVAVVLVAAGILKLAGTGYLAGRFFGRGESYSSPVAPLQQMKFTKLAVGGDVRWSVISPAGNFIALGVSEKGKTSVRLREVGGTAERDVVPPSDQYFSGGVTFSPDGNSIYYVAGEPDKNFRRLYRVSVLGGDPQKLIDGVESAVGVSRDGKRLAFAREVRQKREMTLVMVNEDGTGEQVVATHPAPTEIGKPQWSPDGRFLVYPVFNNKDDGGEYVFIEALTLSDRSTKQVSQRWRWLDSIEWLPGGEGIVATGKPRSAPMEDRGQIWYVPFSEAEPQKIVNDANNHRGLTLTADGRTALVMQNDLAANVWVGTVGDFARARQVTNSNSEVGELCWTPDGRIVYSYAASGRYVDLWVMNSDGTGNRQLTFTADRHETQPSLSPDGRHVVFQIVTSTGLRSVWRMGMDGGGAKELVRNVGQYAVPQVSPDAQWVFYNARDETGAPTFWKVSFDGGEPVKLREKSPCHPSADGKWFVCMKGPPETGETFKAVVVPAAGGDPVHTVDWPKDTDSLWLSPDSQALDYIATRDGIPNLWRLNLASGREQRLTAWQTTAPLWWFAWSRDGKQLAVTRDTRTNHLVLIQNFR